MLMSTNDMGLPSFIDIGSAVWPEEQVKVLIFNALWGQNG
jgi:hypothetical protein